MDRGTGGSGGTRFLAGVRSQRQGGGSRPNSCTCPGRITSDALWLTRSGEGFESIIRLGIDPATGKLASRQDTLLSGNFNNFSVTADGSTLVVDDGAPDFSLWTIDLAEALKGKFPDARRRFTTSTLVNAGMSPDGSQVLLSRRVPNGERRISLMPFAGGSEATLNVPGGADGIGWVDATTVRIARRVPGAPGSASWTCVPAP